MNYKITIKEVVEYPEKETVYESKDGARYYYQYHDNLIGQKKGVDYFEKEYPTGRMLTRETDVYTQEFEADSLTTIIKAVNNIK